MNSTDNSSPHTNHNIGQPSVVIPDSGLMRLAVTPEMNQKTVPRGASFAYVSFLVRLAVPEVPIKAGSKETPLSLAIAIDTSGSMSPKDRLSVAIETGRFVVNDLTSNDQSAAGMATLNEISLVSFSSAVRLDMNLTSLTSLTAPTAISALSALKAGGSTVLYDAILASINSLPLVTPSNRNAAVLLLSDGQDAGSSSGSHAASIAAARARKVRVHTLGLGAGHDAVSMRAIAKATGGSYFSISHPEAISDAVAMIVSTEQLQRAENVILSININNESDTDRRVSIESVQSMKTINKCFITTGDARDARLEVGNVCEGDSMEFLVNVKAEVGDEWGQWDDEILLKLHATAECANSIITVQDGDCTLQTPEDDDKDKITDISKYIGVCTVPDSEKKNADVTNLQMMVLTRSAIAAVAALRDSEEKGGKGLDQDAEPSQARAKRAIDKLRDLRNSSSYKETHTVYRSQLRLLKRAVRLCGIPVNRYRGVSKALLTNETSLEDMVPRTSHASFKMASYSRSKSGRPMHGEYNSSEVKEGLGDFIPADDTDSADEGLEADTGKKAVASILQSLSSDPRMVVDESASGSALAGNKRKRSI